MKYCVFAPLVCKPAATAESLSTTLTNSEQQHSCIHTCLFSRRIYDHCWLFALQGASSLLPCWVRSQPSVRIFIPSALTLTHCWFTNSPALFVLPLPHFAASDTTEDASSLLLLFWWFHWQGRDGRRTRKGFEDAAHFSCWRFMMWIFRLFQQKNAFTVWLIGLQGESRWFWKHIQQHMPMTANFKSSNSCK